MDNPSTIHRAGLTTKKMREVMAEAGHETLNEFAEALAARFLETQSFTDTAAEYQVSKSTLGYWMLRMGIRVVQVAIPPPYKGATVIIHEEGHTTFHWKENRSLV